MDVVTSTFEDPIAFSEKICDDFHDTSRVGTHIASDAAAHIKHIVLR